MIYFYQQEENRTTGRVIGGVATLLYFIVLVLLFLLVKFHQQEVTAAEGGLMINFGNVDEAAPGADMALNDEIADARQQEQQTPKVESEEEQMTQDFEEAPAIKKEGRETQRREESHSATQAQSAAAGRKTARSEPQSAVPGPHGGQYRCERRYRERGRQSG